MILRTVLLAIAIIAFAGALCGTLVDPGVWPSLLFTSLLFLGVAFERVRYGASRRRAIDGAWQQPTGRHVDDENARPAPVRLDPATGKRRHDDSDEGEIT